MTIFKHKNLLVGITTCALFVSSGCVQNLANSNFSPTSSFNSKQINSDSDGIVALKQVFDSSVEKIQLYQLWVMLLLPVNQEEQMHKKD